MYLLKTKHENTSKCDNFYPHTLHCIQKWHRQIFFWQKNILWFWQTWSCWNNLVLPSRTALLWISHTLWMWLQKQKHIKNPGKEGVGVGGQKLWPQWWEPIPHHQPEKAFRFFELSTGVIGSNHSMALTELFMSFNRVGQLYYGLANLLKVCASNLILDTCNLRSRKIILYKVDLGWGLVSKPWIQIHKINLQERNIS